MAEVAGSPNPVDRVVGALEANGRRVRRQARGWMAQCPAHEDHDPSLKIDESENGSALVCCHAGCTTAQVCQALGLHLADLFPPKPPKVAHISAAGKFKAAYTYTDEDGEALFRVVRYEPKTFRQQRPDGKGGWVNGVDGVRQVPYHLPQLRKAIAEGKTIWVCEGEKDAENAEWYVHGHIVATCNAMGAGKWSDDHARHLYGATKVVVVADNDRPGHDHARHVAKTLVDHVDRVIVVLPALGKDLTDHFHAQKDLDDFVTAWDTLSPSEWLHGEEPPQTLTLRWVDVLATEMPDEPPEIIEGMLRAGEFCVIGAPRAVGKTWIGMNIAVLLAEGEGRLFGRLEVKRRARVLYLQGELDEWGSARRWTDLTGIAHPLPHVAETFERLRFRVVQRRATSTQDGETTSDEWLDAIVPLTLEATIVAEGIDVVVVDPWAVYQGGAENSNDQAEAILGRLREITLRTGVAWVVLHHVGKGTDMREPEDLWRGASRLADWASTRITLMPHYSEAKRKQLHMERWEARRYVDVYFLRRSTPTPDFAMHLSPEGWWGEWDAPSSDEEEEPSMGGRPAKYTARDLVRALEAQGGSVSGLKHLAELIGCTREPALRLIEEAEGAGTVTVERPAGKQPIVVTLIGDGWMERMARSHVGNLCNEGNLARVSDMGESASDQALQPNVGLPYEGKGDIGSDQDISNDGNPPSLREGPSNGDGPSPVGVEDDELEALRRNLL